jgi:HTH-type transcriptional regulator / antitoxin HigA
MKKIKSAFRELPKSFAALCQYHLPRPIHDEVDFANTNEVASLFAGHETQMSRDQSDYFETLCTLLEDYETRTLPPIKKSSGINLLHSLLEEHKMTGSALGSLLGVDRSHATKLLRGERQLTLAHVRKLAAHFRVGAEVFISPQKV